MRERDASRAERSAAGGRPARERDVGVRAREFELHAVEPALAAERCEHAFAIGTAGAARPGSAIRSGSMRSTDSIATRPLATMLPPAFTVAAASA